ncbi:3D domain-containing protein [Clostridium thailandense]|uniref:3D domain-containing protein n=1 Tax=Clostridium thailandense TaxID=2794346 RepID=UPI003988C3A8
MNKKRLCAIMVITLVIIVSGNVFAASGSTLDALKQVQDNKKQLQSKVANLDKQIDEVITKVDINKKSMNKIAKDIKDNQVKLDAAEKDSQAQSELFKKRARAMYINGVDSYLGVILSSNSLSDFMSKTDMVSKVVSFDNKMLNKLRDKQQAISNQKDALSYENSKLEALKAINERTLSKLNKEIKEQKELLSKANEKEQQLMASSAARDSRSSKGVTLSRGMSSSSSYSRVLSMEATAYSGDGVTASGTATKRNSGGYSTIAVDPRVIPLGSTVYVEDYGYAVAEDTGGAIKGNLIDVFFHSESEAQGWGRRSVKVYIIN